MKRILIAVGLFALVGCKETMDGSLNVSKVFSVNSKRGTQTVQTGNYATTLTLRKKRVDVKLTHGSEVTEFTIDVPNASQIPANGEFDLQSNQPFDMHGVSKTEESRSENRYGYQSCQYQDYETICDQYGCRQIVVNRWGQQYTEYYLRTINQDLTIGFTDKASHAKLAVFKGHSTNSERVIVRMDRCF